MTDREAEARQRMVETQLRPRGITDERVLAAMARVPRTGFLALRFLIVTQSSTLITSPSLLSL